MTTKLNRKAIMAFMKAENDMIMDRLVMFDVPDTVEDNIEQYLLPSGKKAAAKHAATVAAKAHAKTTNVEELQDRMSTIKNKMKSKKRPTSERALKKREAKKLKKNKEFKKVLSAAKSMKNETQKKQYNGKAYENGDDSKEDIKPALSATGMSKPVFNEEGKMVFSKFDFAAHPGAKAKKSHQNPREILKKIKETDKKISELKESGEVEKASELKNELAWKKAFEKTEGKKVKDDPKLLYKAIKKRKGDKKKSKQQWGERKKRVESEIGQRQKKRQDNLDKRIKDKKTTKLKRLAKRGKVIPGF